MFEDMSFDRIIGELLAEVRNIAPGIDTREGSVIYTALAPAAVELALLYMALDNVLTETFADTASRYHLIKRAAERGIVPRIATASIVRGEFTPGNIDLVGRRFTAAGLNFAVFERISPGSYRLRCETPGTIGNISSGLLLPVDVINGLESARIMELLIPGEDEEETEAFRARYFRSFRTQAFGGNVADYIEKVTAIQGVGGCKVYPIWDGGGTVKVCIINSDHGTPSAVLLDDVQTRVDPTQNEGEGLGIAPIGHVVTVTGVESVPINISTTITYQGSWAWEDVELRVFAVIDEYLKELARSWAEESSLVVRVSQIESRLLNITGILDITGTTINQSDGNFVLPQDTIPVRGDFVG